MKFPINSSRNFSSRGGRALFVLLIAGAAFLAGKEYGWRHPPLQNPKPGGASVRPGAKTSPLANKSPAQIAALVDALFDGKEINEYGLLEILHLADQADASRLQALIEAIRLHNDHGGDSTIIVALLVQRWTEMDPANAFAWAKAQPDDSGKNDLLGLVLADWALQNPSAALAALGEMQDSAVRPRNFGGHSGIPLAHRSGRRLHHAGETAGG